ncbi:hypothetical protein F511_26805 [Dorcoceras hygrometricum]|uniref:Uncharacterized protein n=1 Tax=Dorcoceras hygrometricum TaxID=472368 RepID=A0A2Z7D862_9LAMI|nr:hypothetical protein F511_26805 [Dorcoceras hygrometricum]
MYSPDSSVVRNVAESIDSPSLTGTRCREDEIPSLTDLHRARILRIDHDEARLAAQGCTWYEIKASTLRKSDISLIKDKAGISELYEVVVPRVEARAHRPSAGFYTFYVNQIDWSLRFPIPKFISSLYAHLEVSPSQLIPNSFSSLLSLGILMKFYRVSCSTYTLMQLIQIKRLGLGKFYISNKKELTFIGGNPSSHKGWMSRYFFIKRISSRENPWGCDMLWRDNAHTLSPLTPKQRPDLTNFLEVMREKCFNAQELIEEDLLCHFRFSGKKVQLVGDLGDRMTKAEMMKALKERKANLEEASSSRVPRKEKRKTPSEGRKRRKKRRHGEGATETARMTIPEEPVTVPIDTSSKSPEQQSTEVPYDFDLVKSVLDLAVLETASLHFMQALVWTGEAANRLSQDTEEVVMTRRSMDGVLGRHNDLLKQLEEMRAHEDREKESLRLDLDTARANDLSSKALAQSLEAKVQRLEEENKALQTEVKKLQGEVAFSWQLGKVEFLQSKVFDCLCSGRASIFFEQGFNGFLAQFRANDYSEEEHPTSFLDVEQALAEMPEDSEGKSLGSEEAPRLDVFLLRSFCTYLDDE